MTTLQRLRDHTRICHERLETRLGPLETLLAPDRYRPLLARFYGFHEPAESLLAGALGGCADCVGYARRRKAHLLTRDLHALGMTGADVAALPRCRALPALTTPAQAFGCLYVLEGSTLGGLVISRRLEREHGILPENGGAYFASYGPEIAGMWGSFGAALTAYAEESGDEGRILRSAEDTFRAMEAWLCDG